MSNIGQFPSQHAPLPAAYHQRAANLARWFPEVLLVLGAPGLEETFVPTVSRVMSVPGEQSIEIVLERQQSICPPRQATISNMSPSTAPYTGIGQVPMDTASGLSATLASIESLTLDFEALAARCNASSSQAPSWSPNAPTWHNDTRGAVDVPHAPDTGFVHRFGDVADDLLALSSKLQNAVSIQPTQVQHGRATVSEQPPARATPHTLKRACEDSPPPTPPPKCNRKPRRLMTAPAAPPAHDAGFTKELNPPELTPVSARGNRQVHQGLAARQTGCSRASASKAALWRTQRECAMTISPDKVQQLTEDPSSPKFQKAKKVWDSEDMINRSTSDADMFCRTTSEQLVPRSTPTPLPSRRCSLQVAEDPCLDRSAAGIKQRIDRKLSLMLGKSKANRFKSAT